MCTVCGDVSNIQAEVSIATQLVAMSPIAAWIVWRSKKFTKDIKETWHTLKEKLWKSKK